MAQASDGYQRVPGVGRCGSSRHGYIVPNKSTLWRGSDHLLLVSNYTFYEEYKRFYYRDIQAIVLRRTSHAAVWSILLLGFAALSLRYYVFLQPPDGDVARVLAGALLGITAALVLIAIVNNLRGPTCICELHTAVQTEVLPSLGRLRTAENAIALLTPLIRNAQGALTPETLQASAANWQRAAPVSAARPHYEGRMHTILFSLLIGSALINMLDRLYPHPLIEGLDLLLIVVVFFVALATAVLQSKTDISAGIRRLVWGTLLCISIGLYTGFVCYIFADTIEHERRRQPRPAFAQPPMSGCLRYASLPLVDELQIIGALAFALPGLALLSRFRQDYALRRQEATAPASLAPASVPVSQAADNAKPDPTALP